MEKELLQILRHSLGLDEHGQGEQHRNHFATGPGSKDFEKCMALVCLGLMRDLGRREVWGKMHCFIVTYAGKAAVRQHSPKPPKLTRSQKRYLEYLENADCFDSFHDFLKYDTDRRRGLCR